MKQSLLVLVAVLTASAASVSTAIAQNGKPNPAPAATKAEEAEAAYTRAIEKRTADILKVLDLSDPAKSARVHNIIMAQYRALRAWHDANDTKLKELDRMAGGTDKDGAKQAQDQMGRIQASLKTRHDEFLAKLSADLTPSQVEKVKDKMTYNKVEVTYNAYCEIVPNLTDPQKARILELLKEAREIAMDAGSAEEKSAVFRKYKGKINNYLSAQGHDVNKATKEWNEKQKAKSDSKTAPPAE